MYMHVYLCACTYVCLLGLDTLLFIFATGEREVEIVYGNS